ncbi:serine/threonine-protein kinase [Actinomadura welshii]
MGEWRVPGYSELRTLGEGAQGRVVLARHDATGRPAAIKYLADSLTGDEEFRLRFRTEAGLLGRIRNPYIAGLYGLVETPDGAAIVMEAVDGASLKAVLAERGPLAPEAALALLKGSLRGLGAAHDLGVVHRDYKPANVIVRGDGLSKLIDFGIAVDAGAPGRSGTPAYMAPEQWRGEPASPATDVYAAACVFFECVTGRRPYAAEDHAGLMGRHLTAPVPAGDVPEPLRPLIARGLAKDPWDRPMGAAAFAAELESVASAAYGSGWEGRGVRALAGAAAALAALFPLTALGLGSGGAAGGTAAGGAGAGAAGTAGKGVLGTLGAKGTAAVAGGAAAVAVGGGAALYTAGADEAPEVRPIVAELAALDEPQRDIGGGTATFRARGRIVRVTGGAAPLTRKINEGLRAPLERRWARTRTGLERVGSGAYTDVVEPSILMRGDRLLSVWYTVALHGDRGSGWDQSQAAVVDLRTGTSYRAPDLFRDATERGLRPLDEKIKAHLPGGEYCAGEHDPSAGIDPPRGTDDPSAFVKSGDVTMALTPEGVRVAFYGSLLGYASACGLQDTVVPYADIGEMLKPALLEAVPYPSPQRS